MNAEYSQILTKVNDKVFNFFWYKILVSTVALECRRLHVMLSFEIRYQFLVYNFSIDFMESSRFLILPETRLYFLKPLQYISKALDHFKDVDIEWRVIILRQLILCLYQCSKKEDLLKYSYIMLELSKLISTAVFRESQVFLLCNNICDSKDIKSSNEVTCISTILQIILT